MKDQKPEILFSEPVNEIMGTPPSRIVRTGTVVVFCVFVMFIAFAWIIRYPDVVPSPIVITTTNPPVTLVSKISGQIQRLYVKDRDTVQAGQLLAVMETGAEADEIKSLHTLLDSLKEGRLPELPELSRLGEMQESYSTFVKSYNDLLIFDENDFYGSKIKATLREINGLNLYLQKLKSKEKLLTQNRVLEWNKFRRDSGLYASGVLAKSQFESAQQMLLKNDMDLQDAGVALAGKLVELSEKEQALQDHSIKKVEERQRLESLMNESLRNLKAGLSIWENTYFLISPINGIITFTKYWSINQSVLKDETVLSVVPVDPGKYTGRIYLKMQRSGKVRENQQVNIKLSGYPYLEYGMVRGTVKTRSLVPSGDAYVIDVELNDGLKTLYGKTLDFNQNMQGIAEIITEDIRLIQKIANPLRHMISRNRRK